MNCVRFIINMFKVTEILQLFFDVYKSYITKIVKMFTNTVFNKLTDV